MPNTMIKREAATPAATYGHDVCQKDWWEDFGNDPGSGI
jgi:hypothetical protein